MSESFVIIAPPVQHADKHVLCDRHSCEAAATPNPHALPLSSTSPTPPFASRPAQTICAAGAAPSSSPVT